LSRIEAALEAAVRAIRPFVPGAIAARQKSAGRGPVTEADHASNHALREVLLRDGEGWLSEESADDLTRLREERVWVVDPLDGTREFVEGIAEWCISVALVERGSPLAGGIVNPATQETFLGYAGRGVTYNGEPARVSDRAQLNGALVLASRTEVGRGEWRRFEGQPFEVTAMGSVAYKMARVAAGLADATWTLTPKNEWDVAAGAALIKAAGGYVDSLSRPGVNFNRECPLLPDFLACGPNLRQPILEVIERQRSLQPAT
jgi:myo-inositol-1(or 4)-monophosphatase